MSQPRMIPVQSSAIAAIGYERTDHALYVRFLEAGSYVYFGATEWLYHELLAAPSKGRFFATRVKPVLTRWRKLPDG